MKRRPKFVAKPKIGIIKNSSSSNKASTVDNKILTTSNIIKVLQVNKSESTIQDISTTSSNAIESQLFNNPHDCVLMSDDQPDKGLSKNVNVSQSTKEEIASPAHDIHTTESSECDVSDKCVPADDKVKDADKQPLKINKEANKPERNVCGNSTGKALMAGSAVKRRSKFSFKPSVSSKRNLVADNIDLSAQLNNEILSESRKTDKSILLDTTSGKNVSTIVEKYKDTQDTSNQNSCTDFNKEKTQNNIEENFPIQKPSGPPVIQRVLSIGDDSQKVMSTQNQCNDIELDRMNKNKNRSNDSESDRTIIKNKVRCSDTDPDRTSDSPRKRHRSALNELEELKRRRKFYKKGKRPERAEMKMLDLIYWNPEDDNSSEVGIQAEKETVIDDPISRRLEEEEVDNPETQDENESTVNAPQLKIGPDGNIIIDEQTLVVKPAEVSTENLKNAPVVYGSTSTTTYASFKRGVNRKKWSAKETVKFYKALYLVGTDFSMMTRLMPNRSRDELKKKFLKEDRGHKDMVDCAINSNSKQLFNMDLFDDSDSDENNAKKRSKNMQKKARSTQQNVSKRGRKKKVVETVPVVECEDSDTDPSWKNPYTNSSTNSPLRRTTNRKRNANKPLIESDSSSENSLIIEELEKINEPRIELNGSSTTAANDEDDGVKIIHADIFTSPISPMILSPENSNLGNIVLTPQPSNNHKTELFLLRKDQHVHVYMISPSNNPVDSTNLQISGNPSDIQGIKLLNNEDSNNAVTSIKVT